MSQKKNEGIRFPTEIRVVGSYTDRLLTFQQGKISTGKFRSCNVQQIDQYGGLQTVKTVSCSVASEISAMVCYNL